MWISLVWIAETKPEARRMLLSEMLRRLDMARCPTPERSPERANTPQRSAGSGVFWCCDYDMAAIGHGSMGLLLS